MNILIVIPFLIGYFVESIFGFGGTILAYSIAGFFMDIKDLIFVAIFMGTFTALFIIISDFKNIDYRMFKKIILHNLPAMFLGVYLVDILNSYILMKIFALTLFYFAYQIYYDIKVSKKMQIILLHVNGLIHGLFGTGGPLAICVTKHEFQNKSQLRVTFALFFLVTDLMKFIQFYVQGTFNFSTLQTIWWAPLLLIISIYAGFKVHKLISEKVFRIGLSILLLFSAIVFLFK